MKKQNTSRLSKFSANFLFWVNNSFALTQKIYYNPFYPCDVINIHFKVKNTLKYGTWFYAWEIDLTVKSALYVNNVWKEGVNFFFSLVISKRKFVCL